MIFSLGYFIYFTLFRVVDYFASHSDKINMKHFMHFGQLVQEKSIQYYMTMINQVSCLSHLNYFKAVIISHFCKHKIAHFANGLGSAAGIPSLKFFSASNTLRSLSAAAKDIFYRLSGCLKPSHMLFYICNSYPGSAMSAIFVLISLVLELSITSLQVSVFPSPITPFLFFHSHISNLHACRIPSSFSPKARKWKLPRMLIRGRQFYFLEY